MKKKFFFLSFLIIFYIIKLNINKNYNICNNILKIESNNNKIKIFFKNNINHLNPFNLSSYFGYLTNIFDSELIIPPVNIINPIIKNNFLEFSFLMPFLLNYTGELFCLNLLNHNLNDLKLNIIKKFFINYNLNEFNEEYLNSQLKCFGNNFQNRWCEGRNIGFSSGHIIFKTNSIFNFPNKFLYLNGDLFIKNTDFNLLSNEPFILKNKLNQFSIDSSSNLELNFLTSSENSNDNYFDFIFGFLLPSSISINKIDPNNSFKHIFHLKNSINSNYQNLIYYLTGNTVKFFSNNPNLFIYKKIILGISKIEKNPLILKSKIESIYNSLEFNQNDLINFKNKILYNLNFSNLISKKILFFDYKIENIYLLKDIIKFYCQDCNITIINPYYFNPKELIYQISNTFILITFFNFFSEFSIFLPKNSYFIELIPFKFKNINLFNNISKYLSFNYIPLMNSGIVLPKTINLEKKIILENCWDFLKFPLTLDCYKEFINYPIEVELNLFNLTIKNIFK